MKIALINPYTDVSEMRELYVYQENIGLGLIAARLRQSGHVVDLFDLRVNLLNERDMACKITGGKYELIGISVNFATFPSAIKITQLLKMSQTNKCFVVLGGEHATYMDKEILITYQSIDGVIRGEGEGSMNDLATALETGKSITKVDGLTFRENISGTIIKNPNRIAEPNISKLPHSARDISKQSLSAKTPIEIGILAQRGCPFSCSFCNAQRFLGNEKAVHRYRGVADIVDEIESLLPLFAGQQNLLRFCDATFFTKDKRSRRWLDDFCGEMENRGIKIPFDTFIRADSFDCSDRRDQEILVRLRNIGMISTYIGLEAGDDEQLDIYNKKVNVSESERAFNHLKSIGVSGSTNGCMVFHQNSKFTQITNNILFLQRIGLATFWNISSRAETLPGIKLNDSIVTFRRKTIWDIENYDFECVNVSKLYLFIKKIKEIYGFVRNEDHICRKIRDQIRINNFYQNSFGISDKEIVLDRKISSIQIITVEFLMSIMNEIESDKEWAWPADDGILCHYADTIEKKLQDISQSFGFLDQTITKYPKCSVMR